MNPMCSRCNRVVYPTEKVCCLDKHWHKGCFSCEKCKMTLNMKNYKGFDKKPYCNAHCPKADFTTVVDTPENRRLQQQTKIQSTVLYKDDYEKNKGKAPCTADAEARNSDTRHLEHSEGVKMGGHVQEPQSKPSTGYQASEPTQNYHYEPAAPVVQAAPVSAASGGKRYRAVYDYAAADEDEVSFVDGDVIIEVQQIDEGWMYGRVKRTGQQGMLPANYVEAIPE